MSKEKMPYNVTPGDYDTNKLTDIHSQESKPSSYGRNIGLTDETTSKDGYNSSASSIKKEKQKTATKRSPTLSGYFKTKVDDGEFEYKGEI